MNRRVLAIGVVAVVLIAIALISAMGRGRQQQAQQKKVDEVPDQRVVVAVVDIRPGKKIEPEMLDANKLVTATEKAEKYAGAVLDPAKIVGGTANVAIAKDAPIRVDQITAPPDSVSQKVSAGYVAITVAAPEKPSLYDLKFLKPDDHVDVMGVTYDDKGNWTTSTPLAASVRVLAVDVVWDKFKEEMRRKRVEAEIAQLQKERQEKANAPGDATKNLDEAIKAKREELDPKFENPSVTVEVTPSIAQLLALWRTSPRTTLKIALHRQEDAAGVIMGAEALAAPASAAPAGAAPTGPRPMSALNLAAAGGTMPTVLSMDDVVPLIQRDPKQYADMLEIQKTIAESRMQGELRKSQIALERTRNAVEMRNWTRYGTSTPPVTVAGSPMGNVPPLMVPRTTGATEPVKPVEKPKPQAPNRYSAPIEVYRGSQVSVVGS
ncbi:MAG: Flp pilus assembly protein CpaB [Armatimonadetes bacterium]|nr:Flp pilus assembly protein CpaB [Armatimonadota bacterium]